jgi:hypothetical protein
MRSWDEGLEFRDLLAGDAEASRLLGPADLDRLFDPGWHVRHLGTVRERVEAL